MVAGDESWRRAPLRDLCQTIQYGYTASSSPEEIGPKFLRITDIVPALIDWTSVPYCAIPEDKLLKYQLRHGDIVIARTGATCGYAKRIKSPPPSVFASYLVRLQVKDGVDGAFVGAIVQSAEYKRFILGQNSGAAQPNANAQVLTSFPVPLPPLPAQRKIGAVLSSYDDLIENNLRRIKILEEMAQNLYREWFVKFRFPGHEQVKMVDSPIGTIPAGWEAKRLGDLVQDNRRAVNPSALDSDTPYVGLEHLPRRSIALMEWGKAGDVQSTKFIFKAGEILFGKIRPYFHKVVVAPLDGVCSSDAIVISARNPEWFTLALGCISSDEFIQHATQTSNGTKMPRANWDVLVKYPTPLPSADLLHRFNDFFGGVVASISNMVLTNRNLCATRDLLLLKLVSGEVDVSEVDIAMRAAGTS